MKAGWRRIREQADDLTLLAVALFGVGAILLTVFVRPLEARLSNLDQHAAQYARTSSSDPAEARHGTPAAKLAGFYAYFDRAEDRVDWLAKLYGSARGQGLDLRAADYRLVETNGRISRYEVTLPLTGTYVQVRDFLENALEENPVLSLDQISLRRKRTSDSQLEADAVFTLHLLNP